MNAEKRAACGGASAGQGQALKEYERVTHRSPILSPAAGSVQTGDRQLPGNRSHDRKSHSLCAPAGRA
jgi:hypothetical protein